MARCILPRISRPGVAQYSPGQPLCSSARAAAPTRCSRMENPGPSSAPLISDDPSQRYQRGLNTLKDTQRMVR